jgi:hypothetical protein
MFGQKTRTNVNIEARGLQACGSINRNHVANAMFTWRSPDGLTNERAAFCYVINNNQGQIKTSSSPDVYSSCSLAWVSTAHIRGRG